MKYVTKDEMYNWHPTKYRFEADAVITDELHTKLCDAIAQYNNVCKQIHNYIEENPELRKVPDET
jgi:hypothetical protein